MVCGALRERPEALYTGVYSGPERVNNRRPRRLNHGRISVVCIAPRGPAGVAVGPAGVGATGAERGLDCSSHRVAARADAFTKFAAATKGAKCKPFVPSREP